MTVVVFLSPFSMRPSQKNDKKALSLVLRGLFRLNTSFANTRFLYYTDEIRNAVLVIHGEKRILIIWEKMLLKNSLATIKK